MGSNRAWNVGKSPCAMPEADNLNLFLITAQPVNDTVGTADDFAQKHHDRMPFILRPEQYDAWLGKEWQQVLTAPDHAPLEKFEQQPELF